MTRVYGAETADRETEADERYLAEVVRVLEREGLSTPARSCSTAPTAPASSSRQLKREPVDLLVVGSHGHGLVRDLLFGQTVDKVRHGLDDPHAIARPDRATSRPRSPNGSDREPAGSRDGRLSVAEPGPDRATATIDHGRAPPLECSVGCAASRTGRVGP